MKKKIDNYFYFNEVFDVMRYPVGESHVQMIKHPHNLKSITIEAHVTSFECIGVILTANAILNRLGITCDWIIPYMPFARHDRKNHKCDGLEIEIAAQMLRPLNPLIVDPHSDVTGMLFRHITQASVVNFLREQVDIYTPNHIAVIPDQGAIKKSHTWLNGRESIQGRKYRNPLTGRLTGFGVEALEGTLKDRDLVIIDDICDGGGTFIGLWKELSKYGPASVTLVTTFGFYTKGTELLTNHFDRVISFGPEIPGSLVERYDFESLINYSQGDIF